GAPFFARGGQPLRPRPLNIFPLPPPGPGPASVYSLVATLAPGASPAETRGHAGGPAVYFEPAAVITVLVLLGQILELRARGAASGALRALLQLAPQTARRLRAGRGEG